jgi:hypothetical protein
MEYSVLCYITPCISVKAKGTLGGTYYSHDQGHPNFTQWSTLTGQRTVIRWKIEPLRLPL